MKVMRMEVMMDQMTGLEMGQRMELMKEDSIPQSMVHEMMDQYLDKMMDQYLDKVMDS